MKRARAAQGFQQRREAIHHEGPRQLEPHEKLWCGVVGRAWNDLSLDPNKPRRGTIKERKANEVDIWTAAAFFLRPTPENQEMLELYCGIWDIEVEQLQERVWVELKSSGNKALVGTEPTREVVQVARRRFPTQAEEEKGA